MPGIDYVWVDLKTVHAFADPNTCLELQDLKTLLAVLNATTAHSAGVFNPRDPLIVNVAATSEDGLQRSINRLETHGFTRTLKGRKRLELARMLHAAKHAERTYRDRMLLDENATLMALHEDLRSPLRESKPVGDKTPHLRIPTTAFTRPKPSVIASLDPEELLVAIVMWSGTRLSHYGGVSPEYVTIGDGRILVGRSINAYLRRASIGSPAKVVGRLTEPARGLFTWLELPMAPADRNSPQMTFVTLDDQRHSRSTETSAARQVTVLTPLSEYKTSPSRDARWLTALRDNRIEGIDEDVLSALKTAAGIMKPNSRTPQRDTQR